MDYYKRSLLSISINSLPLASIYDLTHELKISSRYLPQRLHGAHADQCEPPKKSSAQSMTQIPLQLQINIRPKSLFRVKLYLSMNNTETYYCLVQIHVLLPL
ncbi:hypothetical protein CEXT_420951 [Caerostris extrusa]|uniref:Uncharacterized protein n=1 Tax=Caerostris extrusa TaxID=172846 RepID=A0AAV4M6H5_CAEEX|nr:hypothetical protein CEXT_420951 [Caerostris extrusa]